MRTIAIVIFALGLSVAALPSWAQGAYAGVGVGQASVDIICDFNITCSADDSDTAFKIFGGYKFNPYWGVELAYVDGGEISATGTDTSFVGTATIKAETSGFNIAAIGTYPLNERFGLQGKVGVFLWDMDIDVSGTAGSGSLSEDGSAPMFGIGGVYNMTENLGILVEFERYLDVGDENVTGEFDVDVISASVVLRF